MSAYVVDNRLIDILLTFGLNCQRYGPLRWYWPKAEHPNTYQSGQPWGPASVAVAKETEAELTPETASRVGQVLLDENTRSVNHRYEERDAAESYRYKRFLKTNPANVLGLIDCLDYQSCEHPEWETSEAYTILQALQSAAIHQLPGYEWTIPGGPRQ